MPENARLRQAWEELPKTNYGRRLANRHPDVRPEWIMRVIEATDSYERIEYGTDKADELSVRTIILGYVPDSAVWLKVVLEGYPDSGVFHTAYQLSDRQVEQIRRGSERRR